MATKVHMEALSPTMEEGQVVKWLKAEGDEIASGDILAEIETDKATMELVARGDGILRAILLSEGGTAPVGHVIGVIAAADEDIGELVDAAGQAGAADGTAAADALAGKAPAATPPDVTADASVVRETPTPKTPVVHEIPVAEAPVAVGGRIKASPLARRLASEAGLDLAMVRGSGPGGRIVKRDVEEAAEGRAGSADGLSPASLGAGGSASLPSEGPDFEDLPLSQIRKTIARRLGESLGPVPHFFLTMDVDMSHTMAGRVRINEALAAQGDKISVNDIIIKAVALSLRRHPDCNAWWMGDSIRRHNRVHIAVAVSIPGGLITPVVRDADRKGIVEIGREVRELAGRAREKKLTPDEYTGSTFSISNLGMFGIQEFTAVINPPEAGILAVGGVEERAVVENGEVVVRPRMNITMSCDHRVIDGALGARFLVTLRGMLEDPLAMLL